MSRAEYPDPETWEQLEIDATTPEDEQDYWEIENESEVETARTEL